MIRGRFFVVAAALISGALCVAETTETAQVRVMVLDTFARPIEQAKIIITAIGLERAFTAQSDPAGKAKFNVPFGTYEMEVTSPGFVTQRERVSVHQKSLSYRLGLPLAFTHSSGPSEVVGKVRLPANRPPDLWVRLISLYNSEFIENAVEYDGSFELKGIAPGKYILILFDGNKMISSRQLEVLSDRERVEFSITAGVP